MMVVEQVGRRAEQVRAGHAIMLMFGRWRKVANVMARSRGRVTREEEEKIARAKVAPSFP